MKRIIAGLLVMLFGFASIAAGQNWLVTVERTPVSHLVGNPQAPVTLTEYISYTCPHCRDFTMHGEEILKLGYVRNGKLRFEYRHMAADPIDLTASMLARCGAPEKFPGNHAALMAAQPQFNALHRLATKSQTDRWNYGDKSARRRAVASDLKLYSILEGRGFSRAQLDQCLNDQALADRIEAQADIDWKTVTGTPSFAVNGQLLKDVHNWQALAPILNGPLPSAEDQ